MENVNWSQYYKPSDNFTLQGNPALDQLKQQYALRQQQKAQETADFTKEIAKLNFNGARDSDLTGLQAQYGDVIKKFADLRGENNPTKRAQLSLELQQKQNQFLYNSEMSKQKGQAEQKLYDLAHNPNVELRDGAYKDLLDLSKTPYGKEWEQKYNALNENLIAPKFDLGKLAEDTYKKLEPPKEKETLTDIKDNVTGEYKTPTVETTKPVKKEDYANAILASIKGNHSAQRAIEQAYPGKDIAESTQKYIDSTHPAFAAKATSDTTYSAPHTSFAQKKELARYGAQVRQEYSTTQQPTPLTKDVERLKSSDPETQKTIIDHLVKLIPTKGLAGDPTGSISNGQVIIHIPQKQIPPYTEAYDIVYDTSEPGDVLQAKLKQTGADVSLYNQANKGVQKPQPQANVSPQKSYKIKGKTYNYKDVKEGADRSGMSFDEYLKKINGN